MPAFRLMSHEQTEIKEASYRRERFLCVIVVQTRGMWKSHLISQNINDINFHWLCLSIFCCLAMHLRWVWPRLSSHAPPHLLCTLRTRVELNAALNWGSLCSKGELQPPDVRLRAVPHKLQISLCSLQCKCVVFCFIVFSVFSYVSPLIWDEEVWAHWNIALIN